MLRTFFLIWTGCGILCANQVPRAYVNVDLSRSGVSIGIVVHEVPAVALEEIREAAFPCNWRGDGATPAGDFLHGVCEKYMQKRVATVRGTLDLAPLIAALHKAGAKSVDVELAAGQPLTGIPDEWSAALGAVNGQPAHRFVSFSEDDLPQPFEVRAGAPQQALLALPPGLFAPAFFAMWLRRRGVRRGKVAAPAAS